MNGRRNGLTAGLAIPAFLVLTASVSAVEPDSRTVVPLWNSTGLFGTWPPADELTWFRAENSKTFDNHDGTWSTVICGPLHRQDVQGRWVDLEPAEIAARDPLGARAETDAQVQIGTGVELGWNQWYMRWNFHRNQHMYGNEEMGGLAGGGIITAFAHYVWTNPGDVDTMKQSQHWMNDVTYASFGDTSWSEPGALVWQGTLVRRGDGWLGLPLQTHFQHEAGRNLLISFRHQDGSWEASYNAYHRTYTSPYRCKTGAHDTQNPPAMSRTAYRTNILITYYPGTGVGEGSSTPHAQRPALEVSPNPATRGFATVRYSLSKPGPAVLTVFDAAGRAVLSQSAIGSRQSGMSLDLRKLAAGVHLIRLDAGTYAATQKLMVQK